MCFICCYVLVFKKLFKWKRNVIYIMCYIVITKITKKHIKKYRCGDIQKMMQEKTVLEDVKKNMDAYLCRL